MILYDFLYVMYVCIVCNALLPPLSPLPSPSIPAPYVGCRRGGKQNGRGIKCNPPKKRRAGRAEKKVFLSWRINPSPSPLPWSSFNNNLKKKARTHYHQKEKRKKPRTQNIFWKKKNRKKERKENWGIYFFSLSRPGRRKGRRGELGRFFPPFPPWFCLLRGEREMEVWGVQG